MYQIFIKQHFDAAHFLRGYQGKCESLHGHRYQVVAKIECSQTDGIGITYDFTVLKEHLDNVLSRFDHTCLNEVRPFDKINPSSENIATTVYNELRLKLVRAPVSISCVEVWESLRSGVSYSPD